MTVMTVMTVMTLNQAISYTKITIKIDENQILDSLHFNIKLQNKQNPIPIHFIRF